MDGLNEEADILFILTSNRPEALERALAEPLAPVSEAAARTIAPHFVDFVKSELAERYGEKLKTEGLQIYTTLDVDLQEAGQKAVTEGLAALEEGQDRLALEHAVLPPAEPLSPKPARIPD